ncbi:hypothetical protein [Bifidobacterium breve]|uniref:Integrase n=1 Tax=Bifidobacterium breve TaxID=1685 RepID=A0AAX3NJA8_BIFBR|nr:hypothetical protein [Bifidobacterium breve]WEB55550.1 hypothetical protein PUW55_04055 [Bifidobacterium breve]
MANVTRYKTSKGEVRYRVRYRKPDGRRILVVVATPGVFGVVVLVF